MQPRQSLHGNLKSTLFYAASLALLVFPKGFASPYIKPYVAIFIIVEMAVLYCVLKGPRLLLDTGFIYVIALSGISSLWLFTHPGSTMLQDYIWFNYFVIVSLSAYLLLRAQITDYVRLEGTLKMLLCCSLLVCGYEFFEIAAQHRLEAGQIGSGFNINSANLDYRPASLIGNANPLATFTAGIVVLSFNRLLERLSMLDMAAFLSNLIATLYSLSRGGCVGLAIGAGVSIGLHLWCSKGRFRGKACWIVVIVGLSAFVTIGYGNVVGPLANRFAAMLQDYNSRYRLEQWRGALRDLTGDYGAAIVGKGPGSAAAYYRQGRSKEEMEESFVDSPTFDNTGLSILYQYGLVGLSASMIPFFRVTRRVLRLRDSREIWRVGVSAVVVISCFFYEIFPYFACTYVLLLCFVWPIPFRDVSYRRAECSVLGSRANRAKREW